MAAVMWWNHQFRNAGSAQAGNTNTDAMIWRNWIKNGNNVRCLFSVLVVNTTQINIQTDAQSNRAGTLITREQNHPFIREQNHRWERCLWCLLVFPPTDLCGYTLLLRAHTGKWERNPRGESRSNRENIFDCSQNTDQRLHIHLPSAYAATHGLQNSM